MSASRKVEMSPRQLGVLPASLGEEVGFITVGRMAGLLSWAKNVDDSHLAVSG